MDLNSNPTDDIESVNKKWVKDKISTISSLVQVGSSILITEDIDMGRHNILNVEVQDPNPARIYQQLM